MMPNILAGAYNIVSGFGFAGLYLSMSFKRSVVRIFIFFINDRYLLINKSSLKL